MPSEEHWIGYPGTSASINEKFIFEQKMNLASRSVDKNRRASVRFKHKTLLTLIRRYSL